MTNLECAEILGKIYCELDDASKYKEVLYRAISALSVFSDEELADKKYEILMSTWKNEDGE